jgi:PAS domain-containing protein
MASRLDASRVGPGLDFHLAIDAIPALAWSSDSGGSVDYVNQRWREYTGLSPEESYGRGWKTAIYPDDLATLTEKWEALDDANAGQAHVKCGCDAPTVCSDGFRFAPRRDWGGDPMVRNRDRY